MHVGPTVEGSPFHHQAVRRACATAMAEAALLVAQYLKEEGCMQALEAFRKERKLARGDAEAPMKRLQDVLDEYVVLKEQEMKRRKMRDKDVLVDRMYEVLERATAEAEAEGEGRTRRGTDASGMTASHPWTDGSLPPRSPGNRRKLHPKKRRMAKEEWEKEKWEEEVLLQIAAPLCQRINQVAETSGATVEHAWEGPPIDVDELLATFEADPKITHALERMAYTSAMPDAQGQAHVPSPNATSMWTSSKVMMDPPDPHHEESTPGRGREDDQQEPLQREEGSDRGEARRRGTRKSLLQELEESEVEALLSGLHYT